MAGREYPGDESNTAEVIGCSVRGQKNVDEDIPCQDGHEKRVLPNQRYVIAAADGLGSASLSHVGSQTATQAVVEYVEESLPATGVLDAETLRPLLANAFAHARERIREKATQLGEPVSRLNTTLLVAVGGPGGVAGAAVGDGGVVCHRGGQTGLVIPREDTEYENKTIPLQSDDWNESYRFGWVPDVDAAAVFSDGLDGVAWDGPRSVSDQLFDQVFGNVRDFSDLTELETFLADFLDSETLRKSSRDDKTLVVGALPSSEWTEGTAVGSQVGLSASSGGGDGTDVGDEDSTGAGGETSPADAGRIAGTPGGSTGVGGDASGAPRQQPANVGTYGGTASGVDEQLGRNQRSRNVLRIGAVALGVVVVTLLAGFLFLGGDGGGESEPTIDITMAELQGEQGLVVEGTVSDFDEPTDFNVSVVREGNEETIARNDDITADNESLETTLEPRELGEFDFYGDTPYRVSIEAGDTAASTSLERGELALDIESERLDAVGPGPEGSINLDVSVTQGGVPVHEVRPDDVRFDQGSILDRADDDGETGGEFSVRPARSDATRDGETTVIAEFEGAVDRATVELLDPAVAIQWEHDSVAAGEEYELEADAFDEFGSEIVDATFEWSASEDGVISSNDNFSTNRPGTYNITAEAEDTNAESETTVTVEAADPRDVTIETDPKVTATDNSIRGPPAVNATDEFDNPVEDVEVTVTVPADNTSVSGETSVDTDENGVATFESVRIPEQGAYKLTFEAEDVEDDAETRSFDVRTPSNISVAQEPPDTNVSEEMEPAPAANVTDDDGNVVPGVDVTVKATDEDDDSVDIDGDTTVSTDDQGIATFDDLEFTEEGEYTLTFTVEGIDDIDETTGSVEVENE